MTGPAVMWPLNAHCESLGGCRYWRVTLPGDGQSFALIYSIENPQGNLPYSGVGAQVMGPDDSYLIQYSPDVATFWADRDNLALGAIFQPTTPSRRLADLKRPLQQVGAAAVLLFCFLSPACTPCISIVCNTVFPASVVFATTARGTRQATGTLESAQVN